MGTWADDAVHFARKTGASVRSTLRCVWQRPGISRLSRRPWRQYRAPRQAPPDTAEVAGSAGIPVQVGASFVRKPRCGGCHGVPVQAVGAGHSQRRAGWARCARSGVPGPGLPAWLPGPAAGQRAGYSVPDSSRVQDLPGGVPAADRGWVPPPGGVVRCGQRHPGGEVEGCRPQRRGDACLPGQGGGRRPVPGSGDRGGPGDAAGVPGPPA